MQENNINYTNKNQTMEFSIKLLHVIHLSGHTHPLSHMVQNQQEPT